MNTELCKIINYQFQNQALLTEALTHPSNNKYVGNQEQRINYERLEFLGDAVLGLVIAELLLKHFPNDREGKLARRHSILICHQTLVTIAKKIHLGKFLIMSRGEEGTGGRQNDSNLENALEALIGAVYLDGGFDMSKKFILKYWADLINDNFEPKKDPKTRLQEWSQKYKMEIPEYMLVAKTGMEHKPTFEVAVTLSGFPVVTATAHNKKSAERKAAMKLWNEYIAPNKED